MRKAFEEGFLLQAAWIPGTEMEADALSRELAIRDTADWRVCPRVFNEICDFMGCTPEIDLFASRMNTQVSQFYSLNPDPRALDFDALSEEKNWADFSVCYAAPPTKLVPKMLAKIISTRARVLAFTAVDNGPMVGHGVDVGRRQGNDDNSALPKNSVEGKWDQPIALAGQDRSAACRGVRNSS